MNTTHRPARIAAVLLIALVSWAIAAPLAVAAATSGAHTPKARTPQRALVPLASHGAPVPQALRLEGHDRRRVDAGLQGAAGRVRLRPRHGARDSRAPRRTGQGHAPRSSTRCSRAAPTDSRIRYVSPVHRKRQTQSLPNDPYPLDGRRHDAAAVRVVVPLDARRSRSRHHAGRPARRRRHHRHRHRRRCPISPARSTASGRSAATTIVAGLRQQRRLRTRHRGRLADRRERRRRDRHGRLRRRHARHRRPRRRRRHLQRHAGRGRADEARLARRADRQHEPRRQDSVRADPRGRDPHGGGAGRPAHRFGRQRRQATSAGRRPTSSPSGGGRSYGLAVGAIDAHGPPRDRSRTSASTSRSSRPGRTAAANAGVLVALPPASRFDDESFSTWYGDGRRALRLHRGHVVRGARGRGHRGVDLGRAARTSRTTRWRTSSSSPRRRTACGLDAGHGLRHPRRRRRARAGDEPPRVRVGRDAEHRRRGLLGARQCARDVADREEPDDHLRRDREQARRRPRLQGQGDRVVGPAGLVHRIRRLQRSRARPCTYWSTASARSSPRRPATRASTSRSPSRNCSSSRRRLTPRGPHV